MRNAQFFLPPPPKSFGGGQNLNRKLKTFLLLEYFKGTHTLYSPITIQGRLYLSIKQN